MESTLVPKGAFRKALLLTIPWIPATQYDSWTTRNDAGAPGPDVVYLACCCG